MVEGEIIVRYDPNLILILSFFNLKRPTIPDKKVGTRSKFSSPTYNIDNQKTRHFPTLKWLRGMGVT